MSTATASTRVTELAAIVGERNVIESPSSLAALAIDGIVPAISVSPGNAEEVSGVLRYAFERGLVVVPAGGMVHQGIGNAPPNIDILLSTERLTTIEHYDPGDLTIGVGAGTKLRDLQSLVRDQHQVFPLDIANADRVTIGGAMAVAAHGPHKHFFGGLREFCIGVRFVTADGVAAKGGGRVVKNVAGFDLMKLMIGSYGTLGVITSASFKLFPRPIQRRTFLCEFDTSAEAIACRDRNMSSPLSPLCLELLSPGTTGAKAWTVAIRGAGSDRVLARYALELGSQVTRILNGDDQQKFWTNVELLSENKPIVLNLSVPPQSALNVVQAAVRACDENGLSFTAWGRIGVGSLLFALENGTDSAYVAAVAAIRKAVPRDASVVVTRCPSALKSKIDIWGNSPSDMKSMAAVKRALNPKDTLNRGRFLL